MAVQPGVWGIDIGQCALKAVRLQLIDGKATATAFDYVEHPKILSQPDADPDQLTREALEKFLSRNPIKGDKVAISVPGQSGLARFVKLPPVEEKKIEDIVKFEAKQQIPFPLEEVVWDYQKVSEGTVEGGFAIDTEIGLFAMKRDMISRYLNHFQGVNVEVHTIQMSPLALCNYVTYDMLNKGGPESAAPAAGTTPTPAPTPPGKKKCIVALDIGTDGSNLIITDGGKIIWQRPIPIGGNHFTRALTKELKLTFAKAEHLKRNAAKSPELASILKALKPVLTDFVGEVQRSLGYFTNTHRNAEIQYMVGLGNAFRLPGLQKYLQEKLQLEVRKLQRLERAGGESVTTAPQFADNIMSYGVAYGLALQGLKQARLQTNLLPYEVRLERVIRGKKPWMVAAAAALLFGMCLIAMASGMEKSAVEDPEIKRAGDELVRIMDQAQRNENDFNGHLDKLKKSEESLRRIGAGVDERMNWQLLHQYVNLCTPQPNGKRLVEVAENRVQPFKKYWQDDPKAKKAWQDFQDRTTGKFKDLTSDKAAEIDAFIKENLIQVNIIGINALYTDDLFPYYQKIYKESDFLAGMHQGEKEKVKKYIDTEDAGARKTATDADVGKSLADSASAAKDGWVVEIRGYTYHQPKPEEFLEATLIENLKFPSKLKDISMTEALKNKIEKRVGYFHIYKRTTVREPVPGRFEFIGKSWLNVLVKGDPQLGGFGPGPAPAMPGREQPAMPGGPGPGAAGDGKEKPNRDTWKPIGEQAAAVIGEGAGGIFPGGPGGEKAPKFVAPPPGSEGTIKPKTALQKVVPRYEFVILFIWREPIGPPETPAASADKKN